jgi:hypothetical protein
MSDRAAYKQSTPMHKQGKEKIKIKLIKAKEYFLK